MISCTVGVLTFNSGKTLARALESVREFSDIVICDGGSTDDTLEIAARFGARVITQDPAFLSGGRIQDFSGVRNQLLHAAKEQWFFWLDSDEYIDATLSEEVAHIISADTPGAYWVPRLYVHDNEVVRHAVTYPTQQMRFFHVSVSRGFIKPIHERVDLTTEPEWLDNPMYVPVPESVEVMRKKWNHYLSIERVRLQAIPFVHKLHLAARETAIAGMYLLRLVRIRFSSGKKLPLSYEFARVGYQFNLVRTLFF